MAGQIISGSVFIIAVISSSVALMGYRKKSTNTKLATWSIFLGSVSLLIIPLMIGWNSGGMIAGPRVNMNPQFPPPNPNRVRLPPRVENEAIQQYLEDEIDENSVYLVATLRANTAASLIIHQIPAVAIGGFSGRDSIFNVESFESFVSKTGLKYFLMSEKFRPVNPSDMQKNNLILRGVGWEVVGGQSSDYYFPVIDFFAPLLVFLHVVCPF